MTDTNTAPVLTGELITIDGEAAYRIPLTGRDGAGSFALVDPEGLERLRQAGARFLYAVGDGHQNRYVAFLGLPSKQAQMAARAVLDAPKGRRVIYANGDRFDLRTANLLIQPRKGEGGQRLSGDKAHAINESWQSHRSLRRREEGAWKRPAQSVGDRRPW